MWLSCFGGTKDRVESFEVPGGVVSVGRIAGNDVVLDDTSVSKSHLRIAFLDGQHYVTDLNSTNGTFLGEEKIPALRGMACRIGETITVGVFHLRILDGPPAPVAIAEQAPAAGLRTLSAWETVDEEQLKLHQRPEILELKMDIHQRLLEIIDLRRLNLREITDDALRGQCDVIVRRVLVENRHRVPDYLDQEVLIKDVLDEALSLGPLEDLLKDDSVTEVMVNRFDQIYVEREGRMVLTPKIFSSTTSLMGVIARIVTPIGRRIDESSPLVDARLKDGSRVNIIIPPLALDGPCVTIRKFSKVPLVVDDLVRYGSISPAIAEFIKTCVRSRKNIVVSGGTGSGKTTLLNVFSSFIPQGERIVTIEDAAELRLPQQHVLRLEARPSNIEGKGSIPIRDLVKNALRMRPDRIIVGECRGGEALDMLQAMNTGHDGSLTTGHANSPRDMISRLETMVLMSGEDLPVRAIREQIASAVDIIVQQTRFSCGTRKITRVSELTGIEDEKITLQDIFYFRQDGFNAAAKVQGAFMATGWIPDFYQDLNSRGIEVDMSIFHNS